MRTCKGLTSAPDPDRTRAMNAMIENVPLGRAGSSFHAICSLVGVERALEDHPPRSMHPPFSLGRHHHRLGAGGDSSGQVSKGGDWT